MKRTAVGGLVALCLLVTSGCIIIADCDGKQGPKMELPSGAQRVAGGYEISYTAPEEGTVILVDEKTRKNVVSKSVAAGQEFTFSAENVNPQQFKEMGIHPGKANFVLYFYPKNPKTEPSQAVQAAPEAVETPAQ